MNWLATLLAAMTLVAVPMGDVVSASQWLYYVNSCSANSIGASGANDVNCEYANDGDQDLVPISVWFPSRSIRSSNSYPHRRPCCGAEAINFRQAFRCRLQTPLLMDHHVFSFASAVWRDDFGTKFSLDVQTTAAIAPVQISVGLLCIATCDILSPIPNADNPNRRRDIYPLCVFCLQTNRGKDNEKCELMNSINKYTCILHHLYHRKKNIRTENRKIVWRN